MKEAFENQKISVNRMGQINLANHILDEYMKQGYRLTLRQLYYQLVARDFIPNKIQEYAKLSNTCVMGRMNGLIDWDAIEDRLRKPYLTYFVNSIQEALEDIVDHYKLNRQEGQKFNIEIWTEKDAVSNILKRISIPFHVRLMINRGYSSCSALYDARNRIYPENKEMKILYVGDHDPSGLDMLRDIKERLEKFNLENECDFSLIHVALTKEQIKEYNPPPNPTKTTDPRAKWYIIECGEESWELDALRPDVLEKIVTNTIFKYMDLIQFNKIVAKEKRDKEKLKRIIKSLQKESQHE